MTAPDYLPYLLATDRRTPEDVLAWLQRPSLDRHREHVAFGGPRLQPYIDDAQMLAYRLDRERRQACRRGALWHWRAWRRSLSPMWTDDPKTDFEDELWRGENTFECCWGFDCLSQALAFRAAARAQ
jgi:hypothetical protein